MVCMTLILIGNTEKKIYHVSLIKISKAFFLSHINIFLEPLSMLFANAK